MILVQIQNLINRIGGVMASVLALSVIDCESRSGQTKDYEIGICCFFAKHAALRRKGKDWLARNRNNVSEWSNMSTHGLLFNANSAICQLYPGENKCIFNEMMMRSALF